MKVEILVFSFSKKSGEKDFGFGKILKKDFLCRMEVYSFRINFMKNGIHY